MMLNLRDDFRKERSIRSRFLVAAVVGVLSCAIPAVNAANPAVSAGDRHALALKSDGTVRAWGNDQTGQLGTGRLLFATTPIVVNGVTASTQSGSPVAAGAFHTVMLAQDGTLWAWGANDGGQLGDGTYSDRPAPVRVLGLSNVIAVAAGGSYTVALKDDGTVWTWGNNSFGQIGNGKTSLTDAPNSTWLPARVPGLTGVIAVAAGFGHTVAVKQNGTVWAWGLNSFGQLGDGTTVNRSSPVQISGLSNARGAVAASTAHTLVVKNDGTVWSWGANVSGELGDGTATNRLLPVQVAGLSGVVGVTAGGGTSNNGDGFSMAVKGDGTVWAWGENTGSLGIGNPTGGPALTPKQVSGISGVLEVRSGFAHTIARTVNGSIWAWGGNNNGQVGDGTITARFSPVQVSGLNGVVSISASKGGVHNASVKNDGTVWVWGADDRGQLGDNPVLNRPYPVTVSGLSGVIAIAAGGFGLSDGSAQSVALKSDGTLWGWGSNALADNPTTFSSTPVPIAGPGNVIAISAGGQHTLALKSDGTVWSWGGNFFGQLGYPSGVFGDLTPRQVNGLNSVIAVATGGFHNLALRADGTVWAWGANGYGQLGITSSETCTSYAFVDATQSCQTTPIQVPGISGVTGISASFTHSVALKSGGIVYAWGDNRYGQLGNGSLISSMQPIQVSGLTGISKVAAGGNGASFGSGHNVALKNDGTLWAWGDNAYGQLGDGSKTNRTTPVQVIGLTGAIDIAAGDSYSVAVRSDGTVFTWGSNDKGKLGDGTLATRQTPVLVVNETIDGPLDLIPEVPNNIPADKIPPFLVVTYKSGTLSATSLSVDVKGIPASGTFASATNFGTFAAGGYNIYVAAGVPYSGSLLYYQLDFNNNWSVLRWPMAEFLRGVALDSQNAVVRAQILQNVDLSNYIGTSVLVGYGTDPDEMVRNARYRIIFTVTQQ